MADQKVLTQMSRLLHLGSNNESQISNRVVLVQHVGKYRQIKEGVWGFRLRFKLRTNPSGGVWANKNLGITNRVGVDIWDSGWLEHKIYLAQHTSEMAPWEKARMQRASQLQELSSPLPLLKSQHLQLATWELLARLLLCWRLYIYYYAADSW